MRSIALVPGLLCCLLFQVINVDAQDIGKITISLELKNATLEEAFNKIENLTTLKFNYETSGIAGIKGINYRQTNVTVKKVLSDLLSHTSLQYEQVQNYILIKRTKTRSSKTVTIYGFVTAVNSGESLIGATVSITGDKTYSSVTNAYGFYSLTVPADDYMFSCSYVGFQDLETPIAAYETHRNNIELVTKESDALQAVMVTTSGKKSIVQSPITGSHQLKISDIKKIAMAGGEPDVLKSLQFLPGIQTSNEGTTNLSVRGGSYDENLILLDEAPVYNPSHTLGFFSAFNTDALKDVSIYKGVFPARYGGRLSSVIDIRMKEGNSREQAVAGGIGLLASRLTWEGPIKKNKSSFILSARYSNIGGLLNLGNSVHFIDARTSKNKVSFYDLNAKFNTVLSAKDRFYLSAYTGHDDFFLALLDNSRLMKWGNTTVTARWNHVFNPELFANTSLLYSNYNYSYVTLSDSRDFTWSAYLRELTLKTDLDWNINTKNLVKFGTGVTLQDVLPAKTEPGKISNTKEVSLNNRSSFQLFAYVDYEQKIGKPISISYGLRATEFAALGDALVYRYNADTTAVIDSTWYPKGKIIQSYFGAEPKITARVLLTSTSSLKFAYGRNYQFQHLLTNSSVGLPTDIWVPSDTYFKPQYSDQFTTGAYKTFNNNSWEASMELYYRKSYHIIDFRDNADIFLNNKIETQILPGQAKGYGLEFMLKKNKGRSNGWLSYTYSRALRQVNGVNNNKWYPPTYDHRHNFSLVFNHEVSKRLNFSANFVYRSGGHVTIPEGTYLFRRTRFLYYSDRNGYMLPAYHRLDISAVWAEKFKARRKWQGEWVLSVYNVYNRKNAFALFVSQDPYNLDTVKASEVYLTGIFPTIAYNFKF